jgi:threonine/homoserine/homoserine lactone efflux protein
MTFDTLAALTLFAFVGSVTPGPNNVMVMASGANFGAWRTLPHMLGISIGFGVMILLTGLGLSGLFRLYPVTLTILRAACVAYLVYLAWRLAAAAAPEARGGEGKPLGFVGAALFQWVNPKAWALALATIGAYLPDPTPGPALLAALVFAVVCFPCVLLWTLLGEALGRFLADPRRLRLFNLAMACLLLASLWPFLRG